MTITAPPRPGSRTGASSPPRTLASQRRRQLPWVAAGVVLTVVATLGFLFVGQSASQRAPVLVTDRAIEAGQVIERADIRYVDVGADPGLATLGPADEALVIGSVSRGPLPSGTPLTSEMVVEATDLVPAGQAIVGAVLDPGRYPVSGLRAGDGVALIVTTPDADVLGSDELGSAVVWSIEPLPDGSSSARFVSLLVDESMAAAVGRAGASGDLLLVLTGNG